MADKTTAVIVGTGTGLSASLARLLSKQGAQVALAARDTAKLQALVEETGSTAYQCDAADADQVENLFSDIVSTMGTPNLVVYNASRRVRGPITEVDPEEVKQAILVSAFGGFLVAQAAAKLMVPAGSGTILLTGASAGVKGYPHSAAFAMGKFGLRGLAQSMARELHPQGVHVAHIVIDGGIHNPNRERTFSEDRGEDGWLDPDAIAESYLQLHGQHRSAWSWELEIRPWIEKF
jgi:NAD(P)-dependent dehydrogenase (short-subunit alcohol dehydrogenase family)